jgi:hypothetical protein
MNKSRMSAKTAGQSFSENPISQEQQNKDKHKGRQNPEIIDQATIIDYPRHIHVSSDV